MASRRTRIKGIANIPSRRKTDTESALSPTQTLPPPPPPPPLQEPTITEPLFLKPAVVEPPPEKIIVLDETIIRPALSDTASSNERPAPVIVTPVIERPPPPPSPSKPGRIPRIRAVPRFDQRKTSFSASESEDESRKSQTTRERNDSVCSSTSTAVECPSPQKPKEFNSVIQRKCRRTEQSRRLAEARREFYMKFGSGKPDRQKLTMMDLIFYNPTSNPMTSEKSKKTPESTVNVNDEADNDDQAETVDDPDKEKSDDENDTPAPQIKIGPKGEIIIDEQSLVVENKAVKKHREKIEKSKIIDGDANTTYGVYKRAKRTKDWTKTETLRFYKALNIVGTDFSLMSEFFPRRTRRELKLKFKKEERVNKALVDKAVMNPRTFMYDEFKVEVKEEEAELEELERQRQLKIEESKRKRENVVKSKRKKQIKMDITDCMEESDADISDVESLNEDEFEDVEVNIVKALRKPTRSGRIPRILNRYEPPDDSKEVDTIEPGALMVVPESNPGEQVYNVFMMSPDRNKSEISITENNVASLLNDEECDVNAKSIFKITATTIEDLPEENNTTIAEDMNV